MGGRPISGDRTEDVVLWDAGTEVNQARGAGADQAPRQPRADTGTDEGRAIRPTARSATTSAYPATNEVIRVTIIPTD
jgi:hypothetical protein